MARYFKIPAIGCLLLAVGMLTACQEGGEAGDLHGQWRLTGSDTKIIAFSGSVTAIREFSQGEVYGNFQHVGDSLFIQCYSIEGLPSDTTIVEDTFGFKPFNNIRVKIAAIGSDELVLTKGERTWSFYKW